MRGAFGDNTTNATPCHDASYRLQVGNGTACRETWQWVSELNAALWLSDPPLDVTLVDEGGASEYSTSAAAAAEMPELDCSVRSAVSLARRLQDPISELVKVCGGWGRNGMVLGGPGWLEILLLSSISTSWLCLVRGCLFMYIRQSPGICTLETNAVETLVSAAFEMNIYSYSSTCPWRISRNVT